MKGTIKEHTTDSTKTQSGPDKIIDRTVGDLVADDYRTAKIFEKYGVDFCCGGKVALRDVCREKDIDLEVILHELESAKSTPLDRSLNFAAWELSFLVDYIVNTHHVYLKENTGRIAASADKIAEVHGDNHPEVKEIAEIFGKIATDMAAHLREEEEVFFPAVKRIEAAAKAGTVPEASDLETIRASLAKLNEEHETIGDAVHTIRRLSKDYALPDDACNTYTVAYQLLKEFEDDLHEHVHLENNILFPKSTG